MLGGHLLMILNDCLDLLVPKEALTTSVHNKLIKQFFRHMPLIEDKSYAWLKDLGLKAENPGNLCKRRREKAS